MRFPVIHVSFLPATGMALFPFVLVKYPDLKNNQRLINHELIHLRQQIELLVFPFFIIYILHYGINLMIYRNHHKAYRNIVFEREAYDNDANLDYLSNRRFSSWLRYFKWR